MTKILKKQLIVMTLAVLSLACSELAKTQPMIYLIPQGYQGSVIILYDAAHGTAPETASDGTIIYRIPKDGFLRIKPPENVGPYKLSYYYVDKQDHRTAIEYILPGGPNLAAERNINMLSDDEKNNHVFAMNHRRAGFAPKGQEMVLYAFSVGSPKDSRSIYINTDFRISEISEQIRQEQ